MKLLGKYWKLLIALILIGLSLFLYLDKYKTEAAAYEQQIQQTELMVDALKASIEKNLRYKDIQDELDVARTELAESRLDLYRHFPVELKEEDQIMYVLYLETLFGTEINFAFNQAQDMVALYDGDSLQGLILQVNYETTYQGFQDMINYLATDSRITSVYDATISYDAQKDIATGVVTLILYLVDTDKVEYVAPDVAIPDLGKENIFE